MKEFFIWEKLRKIRYILINNNKKKQRFPIDWNYCFSFFLHVSITISFSKYGSCIVINIRFFDFSLLTFWTSLLFQAVVLENDKREGAETVLSFLFYVTCSTNVICHEKLGQIRCFEITDTMSSKLEDICLSNCIKKNLKITNFLIIIYILIII